MDLKICFQPLHLIAQLVLGGLCSFGSIVGFLKFAGVIHGQSFERFLVSLLQLLGSLRNELLDLFILAAELGSKHLLASGKVLFMSIEPDAAFH